jgi:hypothetical protein
MHNVNVDGDRQKENLQSRQSAGKRKIPDKPNVRTPAFLLNNSGRDTTRPQKINFSWNDSLMSSLSPARVHQTKGALKQHPLWSRLDPHRSAHCLIVQPSSQPAATIMMADFGLGWNG